MHFLTGLRRHKGLTFFRTDVAKHRLLVGAKLNAQLAMRCLIDRMEGRVDPDDEDVLYESLFETISYIDTLISCDPSAVEELREFNRKTKQRT